MLTLVNRDFRWDVRDFHILLVLRRRSIPGACSPPRRRWVPHRRRGAARRVAPDRTDLRGQCERRLLGRVREGDSSASRLGRHRDPRCARHRSRRQHRRDGREPAVAGRVLEPLDRPCREPERRRSRPRADQRAGARYDRRRRSRDTPGIGSRWPVTECGSRLHRSSRATGSRSIAPRSSGTCSTKSRTCSATAGPRARSATPTSREAARAFLRSISLAPRYNGTGPPGKATIRVGTVRLDRNGNPVLGRVLTVRHRLVPNGKLTVIRIPVASTPVTAVIQMTTFSPQGDTRRLAAQPAFSFKRNT